MSNYVDIHQIKRITPEGAPVLVATPADLESLCATLAAEAIIAVDTESDSLYSYFDKVCLLQFSTHAADYVVDPLTLLHGTDDLRGNALAILAPIFANAGTEKVFHAAEYDILCLKRDYRFEFAAIFDTMVAARILGWKNVGLGAILQERFGVRLNKKMQRADWGKRPLSREQIAYAREDTHYLLRLRDLQIAELQSAGRLEEAHEEFERLTRLQPEPRRFDPDAYWNIVGARDLTPVSLGILRELFGLRNAQARQEDRPPFKVLSNSALMHIARARPSSPHALARLSSLSDYTVRRYGPAILEAIARATAAPQITRPRPHSRDDEPLDNAARARLGKLKEWRKGRAAARGVETDVIVSNDALYAIARKNPRTLETLVTASGLGPWKAREYGEEILAVLNERKGR